MGDRGELERIDGYLQRFARMVGADVRPLDADGATRIQRGSATVGVNVLADKGFVLLLAPMLEAPTRNREELFVALLEANYLRTEEAAFAVDRATGRVYLRALRALSTLGFEELCELLDTVARLADEWDDKLRARFGA
jgi:hypothetical protein